MSNIDELSRMIGSIQADVLHIRRNTEIIDGKVDKTNDQMIRIEGSTKSAHKRIDEVRTDVERHNNLEQKGYGAITVLGMVFGFIGAIVGKVFSYLMG